MSRTISVLAALSLMLAACAPTDAAPDQEAHDPALIVHDVAPTGEPTPPDRISRWAGFAATSTEPGALAAYLSGPLEVYADPGDDSPSRVVDHFTILGTVTVLGVVAAPVDGWVEVMLPGRPNGSTAWARADEVSLFVADSLIVVDLGAHLLTYLVDGAEVLRTEVGIGSRYNETPIGEFFVTDVVTLADPNSAWGPHALGLSARSETVTEYNGGDGIIGIHGTNNPGSIGGSISLGCVRLPNEMIAALHDMVPIGTRVEIRA